MCSKERKLIWRKTLPVVIIAELLRSISAHVAELVDAHGSGPCAARCGGSSPSVGTKKFRKKASHQAERAQDRALSRWEAFFISASFHYALDGSAAMRHDAASVAEHAAESSNSAHVAELVDAHGSGPCAARCGGSSPSVGTTKFRKKRLHRAEKQMGAF